MVSPNLNHTFMVNINVTWLYTLDTENTLWSVEPVLKWVDETLFAVTQLLIVHRQLLQRCSICAPSSYNYVGCPSANNIADTGCLQCCFFLSGYRIVYTLQIGFIFIELVLDKWASKNHYDTVRTPDHKTNEDPGP